MASRGLWEVFDGCVWVREVRIFVYTSVCVSMHACERESIHASKWMWSMCVCMCVRGCTQSPEEDTKCPALSLSVFFLWTGSLPEPGTRLAASSPQQSSCLHPPQGWVMSVCMLQCTCPYICVEARGQSHMSFLRHALPCFQIICQWDLRLTGP